MDASSLLLTTALLTLPAGPPRTAEAPEVGLTLVSDAVRIAPGEAFDVAVLFEYGKDWHIYWENPGDSGVATRAELEAPRGFRVEGPLYPGPERFDLPGDMVSYGYNGGAVLFFRVWVPPGTAAGSAVSLKVNADWLICKEACYIGQESAEATFEVGAAGGADERSAATLARARVLLPRPMEALEGLEYRWKRPGAELAPGGKFVHRLSVRLPGRKIEFFPGAGELTLRRSESTVDDETGVMQLVFENKSRQGAVIGVLRVPDGAGRGIRFYRLHVPIGASDTWK